MRLGHEQAMAREERPVIQKGQGEVIFKHNRSLLLSTNDTTEGACGARRWSVFLSCWHLFFLRSERFCMRGNKWLGALRRDASLRLAYAIILQQAGYG